VRQKAVEVFVSAFPDRALLVKPPLRGSKGLGVERAGSDPAHLSGDNEARRLKHLDVLQERRQSHVERLCQFAHRRRATPELLNHGSPGRVGERMEDRAQISIVFHLAKYAPCEQLGQRLSFWLPRQTQITRVLAAWFRMSRAPC